MVMGLDFSGGISIEASKAPFVQGLWSLQGWSALVGDHFCLLLGGESYTPTGNYGEINLKQKYFYVTEMRFSKKSIPKLFFHVILWITNEYVCVMFGHSFQKNMFM